MRSVAGVMIIIAGIILLGSVYLDYTRTQSVNGVKIAMGIVIILYGVWRTRGGGFAMRK